MTDTIDVARLVNAAFDISNNLGCYVGPDTPEPLASFLLHQSAAAATLATAFQSQADALAEARRNSDIAFRAAIDSGEALENAQEELATMREALEAKIDAASKAQAAAFARGDDKEGNTIWHIHCALADLLGDMVFINPNGPAAATARQSLANALAEARRALTAIDRVIGGSIKDNGDEKFTLNIKGEKYEGPAVEFLGYALTSIQKIARRALGGSNAE